MTANQTINGVPRELSEAVSIIIRDICEHEPDDDPDSAHISIKALELILLQNLEGLIKPAAQPQGEPVAWLNVATGHVTTSAVVVMDWDDEKEQVQSLYAEHSAPVAVSHPFAEKVIRKLERFQECADDGQGADIGRHWFDLLTQLGLLNRVQRSPALWEMTQQGEDSLQFSRQSAKSR